MKKLYVFFLLILLNADLAFSQTSQEIQTFSSGMKYFNKLNYEKAKPLLEISYGNNNLPTYIKYYSAIALSVIYKIKL